VSGEEGRRGVLGRMLRMGGGETTRECEGGGGDVALCVGGEKSRGAGAKGGGDRTRGGGEKTRCGDGRTGEGDVGREEDDIFCLDRSRRGGGSIQLRRRVTRSSSRQVEMLKYPRTRSLGFGTRGQVNKSLMYVCGGVNKMPVERELSCLFLCVVLRFVCSLFNYILFCVVDLASDS